MIPLCPNCHNKLDACTDMSLEGAFPSPDDYSICAYCFEVLQFNDDCMSLRVADSIPDDVAEQRDKFKQFTTEYNKRRMH